MDTTEENTADENPEGAGQPAEAQTSSADGARDGAGASDGGEVVAHQDGGLCGDIVNTIFHGVCGGGFVVLANAPLLAQPAAVENVATQQHSKADDQKYKTIHLCETLPS